MNATQEIKNRLDIVDIVSQYLPLRKSGHSYAGFCPFHHNTRTPSFYVFPDSQTWHCFGACAEGGDLFSFVMKKEGLEFREALQKLAAQAGVQLEEHRPEKEQRVVEDKLTDLLTAAAEYFHQHFLHAPQADFARHYVTNRQLTAETISTFTIGFALDSWDACRTHFNAQGYDDQDLLDVGLLTENPDTGRRYDRFRNRLIIPIRNADGQVVGFGARTLDKDGLPKYLNSPQTGLFDKSKLLFGLHLAKRHIREARQAVIVEGYMDMIQAYQAGYTNVVAQMGTALTEAQLGLLKRYTKRFVIALDADAAGAKATLRSLQVARETLDHTTEVQFDARGLVQHESRLQADIRVATLPEGYDPDKLILQQPQQWPQLIEQAKPIVAYVIEVATRDLDVNDAKAKTAVSQQIIPLIQDIAEPVERDHYWQLLARTLRVDERALRQTRLPDKPQPTTTPVVSAAKKVQIVPKTAVSPTDSTRLREANYLSESLHHPQLIHKVNLKLTQSQQAMVTENDFTATEDRQLFRQMVLLWGDGATVASIGELCDSLDLAIQNRLQALLAIAPTAQNEVERLADKLALSVLQWREKKIEKLVATVQQQTGDNDLVEDHDAQDMYRQVNSLKNQKLNIHRAINALSSTRQRQSGGAVNGR